MLDLSRGPDALFRRFSENKRTNIRKAIKYGVSVEPASTRDEIATYYAIYVDWSRRKGLPIASEEELQEAFALTGNRLLLLARHQGKIIGPGDPVFCARGHGVRGEQFAGQCASLAAQRPAALAGNRVGVPRRHRQIQPRRRPPVLAQIRRRDRADHPPSVGPVAFSPVCDWRLDRRSGPASATTDPGPADHPRPLATWVGPPKVGVMRATRGHNGEG